MQKIQTDPKALRALAVIGALALILVYAFCTVTKFSISPEIGIFYKYGNGNSLSQVLHKFLVFSEYWYRPFTLYLANYVFFNLLNINNIYLLKTISLALILINCFVVAALAKAIFASNFIERIIIFLLVLTHPLYYSVAFEGSGLVDPFFTIFLNLFVICFIGLLADVARPRTCIAAYQAKASNKIALVILCTILTLLTITSQERGLAIFLITGFLYLYYYYDQIISRTVQLNRPAVYVVVFNILIFALYMLFIYGAKHSWSGPDYRTKFEILYILPNLLRAIELPLRLLLVAMGKGYDIHVGLGFNLLALPFLIALITYLISIFTSTNSQEKSRLMILAILFFSSLPIPVLFGGSSWHFYTAALYLSIATGRALWFWCQKTNKHIQAILLIIFFIWISVATVIGIGQELQKNCLGKFMIVVPEALIDKTLHEIPFTPEVVYYDTGGYENFTWPFGGQGNLFKFIYKDPNIIEIALVNGKVMEFDRPLCSQVTGKKTVYYGFSANVQNPSWHKIQEKDYCAQSNS